MLTNYISFVYLFLEIIELFSKSLLLPHIPMCIINLRKKERDFFSAAVFRGGQRISPSLSPPPLFFLEYCDFRLKWKTVGKLWTSVSYRRQLYLLFILSRWPVWPRPGSSGWEVSIRKKNRSMVLLTKSRIISSFFFFFYGSEFVILIFGLHSTIPSAHSYLNTGACCKHTLP